MADAEYFHESGRHAATAGTRFISVIVFKNGRELPLDHRQTSSSMSIGPAVVMSSQATEVAIANQVALFLNVPFQEIAPLGIDKRESGERIQL
jgi:hypothetical protein